MRLRIVPSILALALCLCAAAPPPATRPAISSIASSNGLLGNPSEATTNPKNRNNYLLIKPYFVTSYNSDAGEPNWVSWVLTKEDLGDAPRKRTFDTDTSLPIGLRRIKGKDYTSSGFDRGHMCPHSDRAATQDQSYSTFVMTNIVPQAPNLNQKAWQQLEDYARSLASAGNHVYTIAGPIGQGGVGSNGPAKTIGPPDHLVIVPAKCWKILVIVPEAGGSDDLRKIDRHTRVIAVLMPNDDTEVGYAWAKYRVSVADIEKETHLTFFTRLPRDVAAALKAKADDEQTPKPVPRKFGE
jgi:endonuclease G